MQLVSRKGRVWTYRVRLRRRPCHVELEVAVQELDHRAHDEAPSFVKLHARRSPFCRGKVGSNGGAESTDAPRGTKGVPTSRAIGELASKRLLAGYPFASNHWLASGC